jgi:hypothetical protein
MSKNENKKDYKLPISTYEEYLKNIDYMTYGIITYFSKRTAPDKDGNDSGELFRWVYKNKLIENQEEIEKLSKNKFNTVMRNVRKLSKMDNNLVVAKNSDNGIIYYINYYHMPHGKFVTIHHEILRFLLNISNSNVIKTYVFLKYRCSKGKTKVTREEICEAIGLSADSRNNLTTISDITVALNEKLIKKTYEYITEINEESGNEQVKRYCYYEIIKEEDVLKMIREERKNMK